MASRVRAAVTPATPLLVAAAVLLLLVSAPLAATQAALGRLTRVGMETAARRRPVAAARLARLAAAPGRHQATLLLLRSFTEFGAAACVTVAVVRSRGSGLVAVVVSTAVLTAAGWLLSGAARGLGSRHAAWVAARAAAPLGVATTVLGPLARLLPFTGGDAPAASEAELRDLVDRAEASGVVDRRERDLINSVFDLGETIVREVMVPRPDVVFIERTKTVRQALSLALRSGFSRLPVVGEDEDDVIGIAYLKDLTRRHVDGRGEEPVAEVVRPASFVPDTKPVDELLREMQAHRTHLAVVVDEYGGTAGLVTIEDILEEIVGEIADEYDREGPPVTPLGPGRWRVTARLAVQDLAEVTGVPVRELEAEDVETVGGLLANALGRVPIPGAVAEVSGLTLLAERTTGRRHRIGTVVVQAAAPPEARAAPGARDARAAR